LDDKRQAPIRAKEGQREEQGAVAAPAAVSPSAPREAQGERPRALQERAGLSANVLDATIATEIVSPDPSVRWRIAGSVVERSTDGGAAWEAVPTGVAAELRAGAAPSTTVCWVVGRGGIVLLSTDGRAWRRVAFPEITDLSAVRATDARTASVTTADGRMFTTSDGGLSWGRP
jgi:photosystem II stability/assembly factor-like uncharacterized protein